MFPETSVTRNYAVCLNRTEISVRLHNDIHDRSPMPLLIVSYCIKHCILWICRIWTILHNLIEMSITVLTLTYISYYIYIYHNIYSTPNLPHRQRDFAASVWISPRGGSGAAGPNVGGSVVPPPATTLVALGSHGGARFEWHLMVVEWDF